MDTIVTDAHRLLTLVRGLPPAEVKARLVAGLRDEELMGVLTALPSRRLDPLMDMARGCRPPAEGDQDGAAGPGPAELAAWQAASEPAGGVDPLQPDSLDDAELARLIDALPRQAARRLVDLAVARRCRPPGERDVAAGDADPATTNRPS